MMMEAICSSETLVHICQTTRYHNPQDHDMNHSTPQCGKKKEVAIEVNFMGTEQWLWYQVFWGLCCLIHVTQKCIHE
jgi:hypothetical protein